MLVIFDGCFANKSLQARKSGEGLLANAVETCKGVHRLDNPVIKGVKDQEHAKRNLLAHNKIGAYTQDENGNESVKEVEQGTVKRVEALNTGFGF